MYSLVWLWNSDLKGSPSDEAGIPTCFEALAEWLWVELVKWCGCDSCVGVGGKFVPGTGLSWSIYIKCLHICIWQQKSTHTLRRAVVEQTAIDSAHGDRLVLPSSDPCASSHFDRSLISASCLVGRNFWEKHHPGFV